MLRKETFHFIVKGGDKDAESLLIDFDLYVKTNMNFFEATGKDTATDKQWLYCKPWVGPTW